jgi:hypothetical protein
MWQGGVDMDFLRSLPNYPWFFDVLNGLFVVLLLGALGLIVYFEEKRKKARQ